MVTPPGTRSDRPGPLPVTPAEPWLRALFDNAPMGMAVTDRQGRRVRCSATYARLAGRPDDDLPGVHSTDPVHPADRAENAAALERLLAGQDEFLEIENRYLRPDGTTAWVHKFVSVLERDDGDLLMLPLVTDISARRRLEALRREQDDQ